MSDMMIGLWSQKSSSEVTKSLIVIHNNVISNKQIVHTYCNDGLLKGLIHLCHSSNDQLVLSLAVSLIQHICSCGDQYIEMFFNLSGATPVLAMMAAGTNTDKSITALNQMLLLHEQAAKLICLITAKSQKYLKELVRHGVIEKVVTLSSVFLPESPHKNCCFDRHAFTETDISLTKQLLEGRKLVGKIYLDESSSQEGELSILMVDLFDTTTSVDVHINEELIKLGVAWPDLRKKENIRAVSHAEVWADFNVTKVVDVNCFWAFIDSDAPNKIDKISDLIEDYIYASNICSIDNLISGVKVSVPLPTSSKKCKWLRGCVMEKDAECCLVLLVDYGHVVKIYADQLFPLPGFITEIPYQANLCLLKGIQVPPKYPIVLQHAAEIICNISTKFRLQVHAAGGTEALIKLCHLPDKNILIKAAAGLTNLSHNFSIRKEIGVLGGTQYILEMCHENMNNDELLTNLLTCLLNLITKCFSNRKIIADANGLLWLIKIYQSSFTSLNNKNLLLTVMKNLIQYGWRLIDPMNVPDVRSIIEGNVGRLKGCFGLQKICNDEVLNAVRERKSKRVLHKGEASSDPTFKSLTIKDMMNRFVERSDSGYKTETDGEDIYLVPMLTEKEVVLTDKSLDSKSIRDSNGTSELSEYCFQQILNVKEDSKNAFFFSPDVQNIKTSSISNTICALLNSSEGGVIYVGVDVAARIIGINITRRERDNIRLGIDELCERHTPKIRHDKYEIHFIPVMKNSSIQGNTQHEERFIVEVRIGKNIDGTLYQTPTKKMLFRQGAKNIERSIQQIREMTIRQEELKYQAEIKALRLMLREVKSQLKT